MDLIIGTDSDTKSRRRKAIKTSTGASTDMLNMVKMVGKGRRAAQLYMPASRMLLHCGACYCRWTMTQRPRRPGGLPRWALMRTEKFPAHAKR